MTPSSSQTDGRLVARFRQGDPEAFEQIYGRYEPAIAAFCRQLTDQREDAEDAVQHTFLTAYRTIPESDAPLELRPWLFTVARNRCLSLLRARAVRRAGALEGVGSDADVLVDEVERREQLRDLVGDLGRLPEQQRAALLLAEVESLDHREIADVLGVPTAKVKALVYQARSSLTSTRDARDTECSEIRQQLTSLTGAALRRRMLRRHLRDCPGCKEFEREVRLRRRRGLAGFLLPGVHVGPRADAAEATVATAVGAGGAATVAGAGAGVGSVAKLAAVGVALVGTAGGMAATDLPGRFGGGSAADARPAHSDAAAPRSRSPNRPLSPVRRRVGVGDPARSRGLPGSARPGAEGSGPATGAGSGQGPAVGDFGRTDPGGGTGEGRRARSGRGEQVAWLGGGEPAGAPSAPAAGGGQPAVPLTTAPGDRLPGAGTPGDDVPAASPPHGGAPSGSPPGGAPPAASPPGGAAPGASPPGGGGWPGGGSPGGAAPDGTSPGRGGGRGGGPPADASPIAIPRAGGGGNPSAGAGSPGAGQLGSDGPARGGSPRGGGPSGGGPSAGGGPPPGGPPGRGGSSGAPSEPAFHVEGGRERRAGLPDGRALWGGGANR